MSNILDQWAAINVIVVHGCIAAVALYIIAKYFLLIPNAARRSYQSHKEIQRPCTCAWSESGFTMMSDSGEWRQAFDQLAPFDSMMTHCSDPREAIELLVLRERMRNWRFYDHLRTDRDAARSPSRLSKPRSGRNTVAAASPAKAMSVQTLFGCMGYPLQQLDCLAAQALDANGPQ